MGTRGSCLACAIIVFGLSGIANVAADEGRQDGGIVQFGTMHEAIGQKQHQGRVRFSELLKRPSFYGVAALEQLQGEVTILDGELTVTTVNVDGKLEPAVGFLPDKQAALLVGAYVPSWTNSQVTRDIGADDFDTYIADAATASGIKTSVPFVFTAEGVFTDIQLHVINGACPLHARLKKSELPKELRAFESEIPKITGTLVGVFARDAVGKLTHPATTTHVHLLYKDPVSGAKVTAHLERVGISQGAVIRFPK